MASRNGIGMTGKQHGGDGGAALLHNVDKRNMAGIAKMDITYLAVFEMLRRLIPFHAQAISAAEDFLIKAAKDLE